MPSDIGKSSPDIRLGLASREASSNLRRKKYGMSISSHRTFSLGAGRFVSPKTRASNSLILDIIRYSESCIWSRMSTSSFLNHSSEHVKFLVLSTYSSRGFRSARILMLWNLILSCNWVTSASMATFQYMLEILPRSSAKALRLFNKRWHWPIVRNGSSRIEFKDEVSRNGELSGIDPGRALCSTRWKIPSNCSRFWCKRYTSWPNSLYWAASNYF